MLTAVLLPHLLRSVAESAPSLAAQSSPDLASLNCTLTAVNILRLLFTRLQTAGSLSSSQMETPGSVSAGQGGAGWAWGGAEGGDEEGAAGGQFKREVWHRIGPLFPITASAVQLAPKTQALLAGLNVAMCHLLTLLVGPAWGGGGVEEGAGEAAMFDFYEAALQGVVSTLYAATCPHRHVSGC